MNIKFKYVEHYLPPRCRKYRSREVEVDVNINIPVVPAEDAPVACTVKNGFDLSADTAELRHGESLPFDVYDVRYYHGKFYRRQKRRDFYSGAKGFAEAEDLQFHIQTTMHSFHCDRDLAQQVERVNNLAADYIFIHDEVWCECGEPRYEIATFGLGHNHGGTSVFVQHSYNGNISAERYFNANDREKAFETAVSIALRRGDTKSVAHMKEYTDITVFMPEVFKAAPANEAGEGDPFINRMERICETCGSANEAGFVTMATALKAL